MPENTSTIIYTVDVSVGVEAPEGYSRAIEHFVHALVQEKLTGETMQLDDRPEVIEITGASAHKVTPLR